MKQLTEKQLINYWNKSLKKRMHHLRTTPKFKAGQQIKIKVQEPDLGSWTWMDECRLKRKGKIGTIIDIEWLPNEEVPKQYSNFSYTVLFQDGRKISFVEEHLIQLSKKDLNNLK